MPKELLGFFGHIETGSCTYWVDSFKVKEHVRSLKSRHQNNK